MLKMRNKLDTLSRPGTDFTQKCEKENMFKILMPSDVSLLKVKIAKSVTEFKNSKTLHKRGEDSSSEVIIYLCR